MIPVIRWRTVPVRRIAELSLAPLTGLALAIFFIQLYGFQGLPTLAIGLSSAVDSPQNLASTLGWALPMFPAAIGVAVAFRSGMYTLGVEGQVYLGAFAAGVVGAFVAVPSSIAHIALCLAAASLGGALVSAFLGWLRTAWNVDIISSLFSNPIVIGVCLYFSSGPLSDPLSPAPGATPLVADTARFENLVPRSQLTTAVFVVLAIVLVCWWLLDKSTLGYRWRMAGESPGFATAVGINVPRARLSAMAVSGALCGLAGSLLVLSSQGRFSADVAHEFGWIALMLALIARLKPLAIVAWVGVYAILQSASRRIEQLAHVPSDMAAIIICAVLIAAAAAPGAVDLGARALTRLRPRRGAPDHGVA